jgi:hypothetical protein
MQAMRQHPTTHPTSTIGTAMFEIFIGLYVVAGILTLATLRGR